MVGNPSLTGLWNVARNSIAIGGAHYGVSNLTRTVCPIFSRCRTPELASPLKAIFLMVGRFQVVGEGDSGIGWISHANDPLRWYCFVRQLEGF